MKSAKSAGRIIGILLFVHLVTELTVPYILLQPLSKPPGFLETAAAISLQVRLSVLVLLLGGAVALGISIGALPFFRQHSHAMALWLLSLAVANFSLQAVENGHWLSMLSLSQEYAQAGAADAGIYQGLGAVVRSAWRWAHYTHLLVMVGWIFMLFILLYRCALVPRALAAIGLLASILQVIGITLPALLGYRVPIPTLFGIPLGVTYLALTLWLLTRGFEERRRPVGLEARGAEFAGA